MKYIFLDFDGVINSEQFFKSPLFYKESDGQSFAQVALITSETHFDPAAIQLVNELVEKSGAQVVCSSSWRLRHTLDELNKMLSDRAATFKMVGMTPRGEPRPGTQKILRGDEIQEYISYMTVPPDSFVIIDDKSDMGDLRDRLVQTTWEKGFRKNHLDWALRILDVPC